MIEARIQRDPENQLNFVLHFQELRKETEPRLRVRLVDAEKFFMPLYGGAVELPLTFSEEVEGEAQVAFSLPGLLNACGATNLNSRVLEFQLKDREGESFVTCGDGFQFFRMDTKVLAYRLCLGSGKNLVLRLGWKDLLVECEMVPDKDEFVVDMNARQPGQLVMRHRIEHNILSFDGDTVYPVPEDNQCRIPYRDLVERMTSDNDLFSLYYYVPAQEQVPAHYCRVVTEQGATKCKKGDYQFSACRLKNGTASFECRRSRQKLTVATAEAEEGVLKLTFAKKEPKSLSLRRIITLPGSRDGDPRRIAHEDPAWCYADCCIPLNTWDALHCRETLVFQILANTESGDCWAVAEESTEQTWELDHQTVVLSIGPKGSFLRISERPNKIRLGILGTCMTRWAFSRKYTDAYRSLYDVTFAHFWPSAFSLAEEPMTYPEEFYAGYPETEQPYVRREYEKTSFRELAEAQCEYVLLDFFVDAIHGPRRLKDGKFIGYKAYAKDFYQDYLMFDSEKYFVDSTGYFEAWKEAADRMIDELVKIFPQNRIVLATGGLTHYYLDENGVICCFDGKSFRGSSMTKHSINSLNYLWDKMNAHFISRLPGAQLLHMRQYNFLAHDRNPANVRPYHFVNEYYRTMSAELSRIVLWDRQNP